MRTSELADTCGVNVQTIRYYERRGLLRDPRRGGVGYRDYGEGDVRRLRFIKQAQQLGFTLKEIEDLLRLVGTREVPCATLQERAREKMADLDRRIGELQGFKSRLQELTERCDDRPDMCHVHDALDPACCED